MKILLVGGGSGGPVSPLLAVAEQIKKSHPKVEFLLVGTKDGPESLMAEKAGMEFKFINSGKYRRYFSWQNFLAPAQTLTGFFQALLIIKNFRPNCVFGAGSFVQVPVVWVAKFSKVPVVLHQQDIIPSLANKLSQLAAKKITVSFESSLRDFFSGLGLFYKKRQNDKIILTGNPFRQLLLKSSKETAIKFFGLKSDYPTLLVLGGGTGAEFLNRLVWDNLPALAKTVQIIHSTGAGKLQHDASENYHPFEFIKNMADAYEVADIVLCRAGMSTITELSNLKKLSIIVPMPDSHQEQNALFLLESRSAIVLSQKRLTATSLTDIIRKLIFQHQLQEQIKINISRIMPKNAAEKIAEIVIKLAEKGDKQTK